MRIFPVAVEGHRKEIPCLKAEGLVLDRRHTGCRPDPPAPDQTHLGLCREPLFALDQDQGSGRDLASELRLDDFLPFLPFNDLEPDVVLYPLHREVGILHDRVFIRLGIQGQEEYLFLVQGIASLVRGRAPDSRPAGREGEQPLPLELLAGKGLKV